MKRILFCQDGSNFGGSGLSMLQLAYGLRNTGKYYPHFLFSYDGPMRDKVMECGFTATVHTLAPLRYNAVGKFQRRSLVYFLASLKKAISLTEETIRNRRIDLVYINTSTPFGPAFAARNLNIPLIWHIREPLVYWSVLGRWQTNMIDRLATCIVTNSDFVAQAFPKSDHVKRVYNGINVEIFEAATVDREKIRKTWGVNKSDVVIGQVSIIAKAKGCFITLDAAERVCRRNPEVHFVFVGRSSIPRGYASTWRGRLRRLVGHDYDPLSQLRNKARQIGINKNVMFLGWRDDIPSIMSAMDIVVVPQIVPEGFGRPLAEAGAAGKPVIASNIGPAHEIVENGVTGLLVPPRDPISLSEAMINLIKDRDLRDRMGNAGRKRIKEHFSENAYISNMLKIFESI